jgi:endo-1,4-beta-xylanase
MKWGPLEPSEGVYDFDQADAIANFARKHGMHMTGHTFVWHQMAPPWLFSNGNIVADRQLMTRRLTDHIFKLMERYADVIDNWDVANEVVSDVSGRFWREGAENSVWFEAFHGADYVALAFEIAAQAAARFCPSMKLYYNDYEIEREDKRQRVIAMIRQLRAASVRIDGIGIQGHINLDWPSAAELKKTIDDFAAEGLLVKISELDVSVYCHDDKERRVYEAHRANTPELEAQIAERYAEVFDVFRDCASKLTSVTLWGVSDDHSWLNYWPLERKNFPLLFDHEHRAKAALTRVLNF